MKILDWNILAPEYFGYNPKTTYGIKELDQNIRLQNIRKVIGLLEPDVICLQEVTESWIEELLDSGDLSYEAAAVCFVQKRKWNVGNVVLVLKNSGVNFKKQRPKQKKYAYNYISLTYEGRKIYLTNGHYRWGNTTFESVKWIMADIKRSSPTFYRQLIKPSTKAILCGDFNCSDINKELYFPCSKVQNETTDLCYVDFDAALIPRYEYYVCKDYFGKMGFKNSKYKIKDWEKLYTTVKRQDKDPDHDDKIFYKNIEILKLYYGDYISRLKKSSVSQPERGLLYIKYDNSKRDDWEQVKHLLTSDHRWIMAVFR